MLNSGNQLHSIFICCPSCGVKCDRSQIFVSAFYMLNCQNPVCDDRYASVVIEKATGIVISNTARHIWSGGKYLRLDLGEAIEK